MRHADTMALIYTEQVRGLMRAWDKGFITREELLDAVEDACKDFLRFGKLAIKLDLAKMRRENA